jgi:3'-phosphoadenosine 5'-phosphosulfate (PAPS) 3'-phosphatase
MKNIRTLQEKYSQETLICKLMGQNTLSKETQNMSNQLSNHQKINIKSVQSKLSSLENLSIKGTTFAILVCNTLKE